jgi:uncharacterized protein YdeI (YjbR/CyaY-like superfamily)
MKPRFFPTPAAFRAWLLEHHETQAELLVGFYKRGSGHPSITWPESVDEALCFGWIDGVRKSHSDDAYTIRFTPRKKTSIWSAVNVAKAKALLKAGKMQAAGKRAFEARTPERTAVYMYEQRASASLTPAQARALRRNRKAQAFFEAQAPWYRRTAIHWVSSAKKPETRERRFLHLLGRSEREQPISPLIQARVRKRSGK